MWHSGGARAIFGSPLMRASWTFGKFPFVAEQVLEEFIAPLRRCRAPSDFQTAGDRVAVYALAKAILPAQTLLFETSGFRIGPNVGRWAGAVGLAEGMPACD